MPCREFGATSPVSGRIIIGAKDNENHHRRHIEWFVASETIDGRNRLTLDF